MLGIPVAHSRQNPTGPAAVARWPLHQGLSHNHELWPVELC